jgi:4'-phosphopantetheinyl transferase
VYYPEVLRSQQNEVHVWWAHARPRSAELLACLDPIEATRHSALRKAADRDRFGSAHALARVVLAGYGRHSYLDEVTIRSTCKLCGADGHGKPALNAIDPEFTFNLAYAGARVGIVVARVPVGIDIVVMGEPDDVSRVQALAPSESTWLSGRPAPERPHAAALIWARKEALLKATGDGHSVPLADLVVSAPDAKPALIGWAGGPDPKDVQIVDLNPGAGHVGALALLLNFPHGEQPFHVIEHDGEPLLAAASTPPAIA